MNSRVIKIIAVVSMLVDHMGTILFPHLTWMRIIGRIAFPLFCFQIAFGATKTRNIWKYVLRLFVFALVTQVALSVVLWEIYVSWLNVFFTLSAGVLSIIMINKAKEEKNPVIAACVLVIIIVLLLLAELLHFDYGMMGVALIIMFYLPLTHSLKWSKITMLPVFILFNLPFALSSSYIQLYSMISAVFLLLFVDKKLRIPKWERWAFYVFYPLHLVILHLINIF